MGGLLHPFPGLGTFHSCSLQAPSLSQGREAHRKFGHEFMDKKRFYRDVILYKLGTYDKLSILTFEVKKTSTGDPS